MPQTGRLTTMEIYSVTVLDARHPNARCQQGHVPFAGSKETLPSPLPATASPRPFLWEDASLRALLLYMASSSVRVSSLLRTIIIGLAQLDKPG